MTFAHRRHWIVAALCGAVGVILLFAIVVTALAPGAADSLGLRSSDLDADATSARAWAAVRTFVAAGLGASIIGLPVALAFTAVMAVVERSVPTAQTLTVWLCSGVIAGLPVVYCLTLLIGGFQPMTLLGALVGVLGAGLAWLVRYGPGGQLA